LSLPLIVLDDAEDELRAAADRYEEQVPGLGAEFRIEIDQALQRISSLPRAGRPVPGRSGADVRRAFVRRFPFSIIYLVEPTVVWVVAFAHHRRRPGYWKSRVR
jgi:toxin ParE1/3/4